MTTCMCTFECVYLLQGPPGHGGAPGRDGANGEKGQKGEKGSRGNPGLLGLPVSNHPQLMFCWQDD